MEQLSKTAHTDSADAYEKYFAWIIKIYLVHNATVLSVLISYYSLYYKHWLEKYNCNMKLYQKYKLFVIKIMFHWNMNTVHNFYMNTKY